jgi:hypothetical protein
LGGLTRDAKGRLYGTTYFGGIHGSGTIYQMHMSSGGTWTETLVYSFRGTPDGQNPTSEVTFDADGNLFGTSLYGGYD